MFGFVTAFGFVLLLLGLTLKGLKRFSGGVRSGASVLQMEVVQRLALGPKQGIAVVRIGERLVAVSMGEGGVRPLVELGEEEMVAVANRPAPVAPLAGGANAFASILKAAGDSQQGQKLQAVIRESPRARKLQAVLRESAGARKLQAILRTALRSARPVIPAKAGIQKAKATASALSRHVALILLVCAIAAIVEPSVAAAQADAATIARTDTMLTRLAPAIDLQVGDNGGGLRLSGTVGVVVMMGLLTLLPTLVLMMTSFTRIFIVLHFLRQAIGTQSAPPGQLMAALALLLTGFVMGPTLSEVNRTALEPWMAGQMDQGRMLATAAVPFREFMLNETREEDIAVFLDMRGGPEVQTVEEVPLVVLMSAFVTSELKTAFQIGFALFLPFIVIDVVVASVLMSMGMFMLPPPMIALPFKILLFVLVDGWTLVIQGLVQSFG